MISTVLGFLGGAYGKIIGIGVLVASVLGYWWYLTSSLDSAREAQKYAEDNVILVTYEFDRLYGAHTKLIGDAEKQVELHKASVVALKKAQKVELARAIKLAEIRGRINNVREEDDGNVSRVLSDTLDALRLYN